jgi:hypothetical protein
MYTSDGFVAICCYLGFSIVCIALLFHFKDFFSVHLKKIFFSSKKIKKSMKLKV